jgi:PEP-CTERM motif
MKNKTQKTWLWLGIIAVALTAAPKAAHAGTNGFVVPFFRGSANSESGYWEVFGHAVGVNNLADRPGSTTGAGLLQNNPDAFLTGSGNIYNFATTNSFVLTDTTPFTLGTIVLQTRTLGNELDYSSMILSYSDGSGSHTVAPLFRDELDRDPNAPGGTAVSSLWQWNLTGLDITDYAISFNAGDTSVSFDSMTLDNWNQFAPVPEPSALALAGGGLAMFGVMAGRRKKSS